MQIVAKGATASGLSCHLISFLPTPVNFLHISHGLLSDIQRRDQASEKARRHFVTVGKQEATI